MKVELKGVTKRYGSVVANDHVDLRLTGGQVHALLGENGAGKTTLMNILYGLCQPDEGQLFIDGEPIVLASPADAIRHKIGMVHQKLMLVPAFTVAENVMLGNEDVRVGGVLTARKAERRVAELAERYGLPVNPCAVVADLPVGVRQRVEILKALYRKASLLILDEPTAVLTPQETDELLTALRSLTGQGCGIAFISHKLREVKSISDTITVIRRGQVVGTAEPSCTEDRLAELMVGRPVRLRVGKAAVSPGSDVLDVRDLTVEDQDGRQVVDGISMKVRSGEIVGIAGVEGNGQTPFIEALVGLRRVADGTIILDGRDITSAPTRQVLRSGVGYVPEDRHGDGLVGSFSIADNLVINQFAQEPFAQSGLRDMDAIGENAHMALKSFDIRARGPQAAVDDLSGGNQQRIVLARALSRPVRLLIAAQPTRGVDVGAMEFVHRRIVEERDKGAAVLLVSSDLEELLVLADRLVVFYAGRVMAECSPDVPATRLGALMGGSAPQDIETPTGAG